MKVSKIKLRAEKQNVSGVSQSDDSLLSLQQSFKVSGATRALTESHTIDLNDDSIIELVYDDNTVWIASPDTIGELHPELETQNLPPDGIFDFPIVLRADDSQRGVVSDIALKVFNIFVKKKVSKEVVKFATELEKKQLENQSGIYRVDPDFTLRKFTPEKIDSPYLLFLHGTASSTKGSFDGLLNTDCWREIQKTYGSNVLAFQHESLTKSPLQNALELVNQLPKNATLHIISQSRGGLVGDLLSRFFTGNENNRGFSQIEISNLRKEKRKGDLEMIDQLLAATKNKKIFIKKFIRVACPAGGTTLASKRLDNFFNITLNLIGFGTGMAANPVYGALKNLIVAVIDSKNKVDVLPGLEAMNPSSPFIKLLNNPVSEVTLDNSIAIVAGNSKMRINLKGLLIIASKLFFRQDNDLIVNTRSMYLSAAREQGKLIQYFFDEGSEVDHFHYFKNKRTNEAIALALKAPDDTLIPTFETPQNLISDELTRNALLGIDGGQVFSDTVTGTKPILVLLPGIMGSNLTKDDKLLWINYGRFITGKLTQLKINTQNIDAPSLIRTSYKKLVDHLSHSYDVVTFPYDWRLQLKTRAQLFDVKIRELLKYNQPIKIIGHSMGGVLVRDFIVHHNKTWETLNASLGFKVLFLGAPLGGSFRIPSVLFGFDSLITKLAKIDLLNSKKDLLGVFSKLPGLLSLLPFNTDDDNDFSKERTWSRMKEAFGDSGWPLPLQSDLNEFKAYRDKALQADIDFTNISYIAGRDKSTPCGYRIDSVGNGKELVFLSTAEGDQSVTWESGIPTKMIQSNSVYYVDVTHGALANEPEIFNGIDEIIATGSTNLLSKTRPIVRGDQKIFRSPEFNDFDLSPEGIENTILGLTPGIKSKVSERPLCLSVSNGDLKYASFPVMAGHFKDDGILYAEKAINHYLKGALNERHQLGLYPGLIGTNEVLLSSDSDFKGSIIIGLGELGKLTAYQLTKSVEQGASNYLIQLNSKNFPETFQPGISSLIIASGYGGLTLEDSANAIVNGVSNANAKIRKLHGDKSRLIEFVEFVEQDKGRALNCFHALHKIEKRGNQSVHAVMASRKWLEKPGAVQSQAIDETTGWWTRITVQHATKCDDKPQHLLYNISTGGAREEQRPLFTSEAIIEELVNEISTENQWTAGKAKTIFELLIPNDFKDQVKKQNNITWLVDKHTAAYPWELLQDGLENARPLAVNAGMIRQLITKDYRTKINAVNNKKALVVGDPDLKGYVNQLPGALKEGQLVNSILSSHGFETATLLKSSSGKIIEALFSQEYKIIHLAGHGVFNPEVPENSGMVIGNGIFLTTREIVQMSTVPELVFVNCCFLGKESGGDEQYYQNRFKLAANIGTQLIENGVKVVIAAGWAVDDNAALEFTNIFYNSMFDGDNFGNAIKKARQVLYEKHGDSTNTWGAYQCYGDQFYKFRRDEQSRSFASYKFLAPEEALIELFNLHSAMETANYAKDEYLSKLHAISKAVDQDGVRSSEITEKEAMIYSELNEYELAISKFSELKELNTALSPAGEERYCSIRAKQCVIDFVRDPKKVKLQLKTLDRVIADMQNLLKLGHTASRLGVMASSYKRKSILVSGKLQKIKTYEQMATYYQLAYTTPKNPYAANALANWLETEHFLIQLGKRKWGSVIKVPGAKSYQLPITAQAASKEVKKVRSSMLTMPPDKMDYRDLVGLATLSRCLHVLSPDAKMRAVLDEYKNIWNSAGTMGKKMAELEHFDFLIDASSLLPKANKLKQAIEQLKKQLEEAMSG